MCNYGKPETKTSITMPYWKYADLLNCQWMTVYLQFYSFSVSLWELKLVALVNYIRYNHFKNMRGYTVVKT